MLPLIPGIARHISTGPRIFFSDNVSMNTNAMDEYQRQTASFATYPRETALGYVGLGLAGEAGEVANQLKKIFRDDAGSLTDDRKAKILDELGDVLWYCAALARELNVPLSEVAQMNIDKLSKRHGKTPT